MPANILKKHLAHFRQRILSRNALLGLSKPTRGSKTKFDVGTIFEGVPKNILAAQATNTNAVSAPNSLLSSLLLNKDATCIIPALAEVVAVLTKIRLSEEDNYHLTGHHSLYIGYPMLYVKRELNKSTCSPLFLIPVTLSINAGRIHLARYKDKEGEDFAPVLDNALLPFRLKSDIQHVSVDLKKALELLNDDNLTRDQLDTLLQDTIRESIQGIELLDIETITLNNPLLFSATLTDIEITAKFNKLNDGNAFLSNSAMLSVLNFKGQNTIRDMEILIETVKNQGDLGVLKLFLHERQADNASVVNVPMEAERWLVTDSDPSQEQAVWQGRGDSMPLMVLQGPPGTGKSQTIVNIIADALAKNKTVAIFCEKPAALKVVQKRLEAIGLGALCLYVDDVTKNRASLITSIKAIQQDCENQEIEQERTNLAETIRLTEQQLDENCQRLGKKQLATNTNQAWPRYADCYAMVKKLKSEHGGRVSEHHYNRVDRLYRTIHSLADWKNMVVQPAGILADDIINYNYDSSVWHQLKELKTPPAAEELKGILDQIDYSTQSYTEADLLPAQTDWLYQHPFSVKHSAVFLTQAQKRTHIFYQEAREAMQCLSMYFQTDFNQKYQLNALSLREVHPARNTILTELANNISSLPTISRIAHKLEEEAPKVWRENLAVDIWCSVLTRIGYQKQVKVYEASLGAAPLEYALRSARLKDTLMEALKFKRKLDSQSVQNRYRQLVGASNTLNNAGLLRLKASTRAGVRTPKTEVRHLFSHSQEGFTALMKIHPVLLTSPTIAATILPVQAGLFDVVIIDEASQMFSAEGLGLLYRGKKVVIAGDSKQMPPSNFFGVAAEEDIEEAEEVEIQESRLQGPIAAEGEFVLLDMAEAALNTGSPNKRTLQMHYRSATAELIEFSNHAFYAGSLQAATGNVRQQSLFARPIQLVQLTGEFKAGVNKVEINAIVLFLQQLWLDAISPSVGVIVFNALQASELEDMLEKFSQTDTAFNERWQYERKRTENEEDVSFFIRSVENVQGDERDCIILGTTYSGVSKLYGPLSKKEDGRRRLNVAITRAKQAMLVFSSLTIDNSDDFLQGQSEGRFLHQFLRYAQGISNNNADLVNQVLNALNTNRGNTNKEADYDSPFEQEVSDFLTNNGYTVVNQIGESGFRIDLAIKNANGLGFLCGIECDGASYHSGWRARQNDIWRQKILESKGWKIIRVWSTDWFHNHQQCSEKLLAEIEQAQNNEASILFDAELNRLFPATMLPVTNQA